MTFRQDHGGLSGVVRVHRRWRADQRLVALEPESEAGPPSPSNNAIKAWPDMAEYATGYQTAYGNLNGGRAATLFSSFDQQSVNTHFLWMQQNGYDAASPVCHRR